MSLTKSPELRFFDQSYQDSIEDLNLIIQASQNNLLIAYFDAYKKQFIGVEEKNFDSNLNWHQLSEQLVTELDKNSVTDYKSVSFALIDQHYTLIPSSLFEKSDLQAYLQLNHTEEDQKGRSYHAYSIPSLETQLAFSVPDVLKNKLEERFKKLQILHYTAPLLEAFSLNAGKEKEMHLNILKDRFDILYAEDGKLKMLNTFRYDTVEDFIYYLLYVMEQLNVDRNHIELKVYGEIQERSSLYDILFKYVRHPHLVGRSNAVQYSQCLNSIAPHQYRTLFNQYLCA